MVGPESMDDGEVHSLLNSAALGHGQKNKWMPVSEPKTCDTSEVPAPGQGFEALTTPTLAKAHRPAPPPPPRGPESAHNSAQAKKGCYLNFRFDRYA